MAEKSEADRISRMIGVIMKVAQGDYSVQVELSGRDDDLDSLAMGLNMMIDDVHNYVSRQQKTEHELRIKSTAVESSINAIALADLQGNLTDVNTSFLTLWGYGHDGDVLGRPAVEFWQMEDKAAEIMGQLAEKGGWVGEMSARKKDGSAFDVQVSANMVLGEDGRPICMMASFVDITERKKAEAALRKKTHELGERVKELNCLFGISKLIEKKGASIDAVFQAAADILASSMQYPAITCARVTIEDKEFRTENHAAAQWTLRSDISVFGEKAGIVEVACLEERPQFDGGPFIEEERQIIHAVTERLGRFVERRRAEEALRGSEEKWHSLTQNTDDTILIVDTGDVIRYSNRMIPPQTPEDVIGKTVYEYAAEEHHDVIRAAFEKVYETGKPQSYIVPLNMERIDPQLGTLWYSSKIVPIKTGKEITGIIMIATDITGRKRAEEERGALLRDLGIINRRLEESNRELQDFAYVASHDMQEPLRKITSFGRLLRESLEGKLDEDQEENIGFMIDGAGRMQAMIDDLLAYARVASASVKPEAVDLNDVIKDLSNVDLAVLLEETGGALHVPEALPAVQGDPSQVRRLFQNLIGNGLKFHRDGTKPEVAVLARRTENSMIRIEVRDNGIGFDEACRDQVFTMFRRLHSRTRYKGTGIGLSVCRKIVSRHGGDIGVDSIPGRGSTFWFTLPGLRQEEAL